MKTILFISFFSMGFFASGQFGNPYYIENTTTPFIVSQIAAADIDNDGWEDVITATTGPSGKLAFYTNNGDGSFGSQQTIASGAWFLSIAVADVNSDGWVDLISTQETGNEVRLFLNNNGVFGAGTTLDSNIAKPNAVTAGDFDVNGFPDFVVVYGLEAFFFRNMNGTTFNKEQIPDNFDAYSIDKADMDGDGDMDLVFGFSTLDVFLNDGDGNFGFFMRMLDGGIPFVVHTADIDGNGDFDVLFSSGFSQLQLSLNQGNGFLSTYTTISNAVTPHSIDTYDFDGDGLMDIFVGGNNGVVWFKNLGNLSFSNKQNTLNNTNLIFCKGTLSDINNDGAQDILWYAHDKVADEYYLAYQLTETLGVSEKREGNFAIFPNPVKNTLFIASENHSAQAITVHSIDGSVLISKKNKGNSIDVSGLSPGMYFLEIVYPSEKSVGKFIKK